MAENGGPYGYIDNVYPCGIFSRNGFHEVNFSAATILYGGNGSGKSSLLNLIAQKLQLKLVKLLETMTRYCGCQFIIATHSPFLLAMEGARIYDLDASPVDIKNWWELENTRIYYEFFKEHRDLFEK